MSKCGLEQVIWHWKMRMTSVRERSHFSLFDKNVSLGEHVLVNLTSSNDFRNSKHLTKV